MKRFLFRRLAELAFLAIIAQPLAAQTDEELAKIFEWKFTMDAPDGDFEPLEEGSGWSEPATSAKVICMATPVPYSRMQQDLEALSSEEGQKVLEKGPVTINGVPGLLILLEFSPLAGEDSEVMYSLMYARPFQDISLVLNAQYPKSQHERLYAKMLTAFGTVRKKEN